MSAATAPSESPATALATKPPETKTVVPVSDNSPFANLLDSAKFAHLWRVATVFAASELVPAHYRGKPESCFIAVEMAVRLGIAPFMFMQNTYVVHGRPGIEAKLAIALVNSSGIFNDSLDYEVIGGADPFADGYKVRAFAVRKSTGKRVDGPWIDWALVRAEKWNSKEGSKWITMPGQMFLYRAAMFFARVHCPERLLGMYTADELEEAPLVRAVENLADNKDRIADARTAVEIAASSMSAGPKPAENGTAGKADEAVAKANEALAARREEVKKSEASIPSDDTDLLGQTGKSRTGRKL